MIKVNKKFVGLVFHFGGLLEDRRGVFIIGTSKFGRKLAYQRIEEVDPEIILDFIEFPPENHPLQRVVFRRKFDKALT